LLGPEISNVKATDVTKEAATLSWDQVTGLAPLGANGEIAYKVCPKDPASTETCKEGTVAERAQKPAKKEQWQLTKHKQ